MTILAFIIILIGLLVWWYIWRSYYTNSAKLFSLLLIILVAFFASWLGMKYLHDWLRWVKPSSALWTWFIISSVIALISLLVNKAGRWCGNPDCWCMTWGSCTVPKKKTKHNNVAKASAAVASWNSWNSDDLKVIEGIWPVIEKHLNENWIRTYEQLADTDPIHIKNILDRAWDRLAVHDPSSRPTQSVYARDKDLTGLSAYQETLKAWRA